MTTIDKVLVELSSKFEPTTEEEVFAVGQVESALDMIFSTFDPETEEFMLTQLEEFHRNHNQKTHGNWAKARRKNAAIRKRFAKMNSAYAKKFGKGIAASASDDFAGPVVFTQEFANGDYEHRLYGKINGDVVRIATALTRNAEAPF